MWKCPLRGSAQGAASIRCRRAHPSRIRRVDAGPQRNRPRSEIAPPWRSGGLALRAPGALRCLLDASRAVRFACLPIPSRLDRCPIWARVSKAHTGAIYVIAPVDTPYGQEYQPGQSHTIGIVSGGALAYGRERVPGQSHRVDRAIVSIGYCVNRLDRCPASPPPVEADAGPTAGFSGR